MDLADFDVRQRATASSLLLASTPTDGLCPSVGSLSGQKPTAATASNVASATPTSELSDEDYWSAIRDRATD